MSMSILGPCHMVLDRTKYQAPFGMTKCLMDILDRTKCLLTVDSNGKMESVDKRLKGC